MSEIDKPNSIAFGWHRLETEYPFDCRWFRVRTDLVRWPDGRIAPASSQELTSLSKQYRLYSRVFPFLNAVSKMDGLLFFLTGYAVSVAARRP